MRRVAFYPLSALFAVVPVGCNILFPPSETGSSELRRFTSAKELSDYFQDQIQARNSSILDFDRALEGMPSAGAGDDADGGNAPPQAVADEDGGVNYSDTTTQEEGVAEADVVKTDGEFFYMLDTRFDGTAVLRIVSAAPIDQMSVESETELEGWGQDLYLRGNRVIAVTSGGGFFIYLGGGGGVVIDGGGVADGREGEIEPGQGVDDGSGSDGDAGLVEDNYEYERPFTAVTIVDVSDRGAPTVLSSTRFDGSPASSRMIDGVLHLVLANYQGYYYDVMPLMGRPDLDPSEVEVGTLLPDYEKVSSADGTTAGGDLVTWENLYRPSDPDGFGVVTVVSMDTDDPDAAFTSVGIVAEPGLIYSSLSALYLTDTNYNFQGDQRTNTDIYKLAYDGASAAPVATGTVPGRVLNQYSMGEHEDNLRVATTIDPVFFFDETGIFAPPTEPVNAVYVLGQSDEGLSIIGRAENIAPGETIQSARFAGDRGYLVTFRQIDPLFTLDLSDASDPRIVGELHVPGFSTFLLPMDEDHLLAVGQYVPPPGEFGPWGVQLSVFDVSDMSEPTRTDNIVIGGDDHDSYSEALWNPKAFTTYREPGSPDDAPTYLVALPVSIYGRFFVEDLPGVFDETGVVDEDGGGSAGGEADEPPPPEPGDEPMVDEPGDDPIVDEGFEGVVVFRAGAAGLEELGRISTRFDELGYWYPAFSRGIFIEDEVYAVTSLGIRAATVDALDTIAGEIFYGPEMDDPRVVPVDPGIPVEPLPTEPVEGKSEMMPDLSSGG